MNVRSLSLFQNWYYEKFNPNQVWSDTAFYSFS